MAGTTPGGLFRYPYDIATLKPDDPNVSQLADRDRALEDYLAHVGTTPSGGGARTYYTIATTGASLGGAYGSNPAAQSAADYLCTGTGDSATIQAAIDAAASSTFGGTGLGIGIIIESGLYLLDASLDPKGCTIMGSPFCSPNFGQGPFLYANAALGGAFPGPVFQGVGGSWAILRGLGMGAFGAAAIVGTPAVQNANWDIQYCTIQSSNAYTLAGNGSASIYLYTPTQCSIKNNFLYGVAIGGLQDSIHFYGGTQCQIVGNNFSQGGILLEATDETNVSQNYFSQIDPFNGGFQDYVIGLYAGTEFCHINDNYGQGTTRWFIVVDNANNNTIEDNRFRNYAGAAVGTYDGIILRNNSDQNCVQGNHLRQGVNTARTGIRINAATENDNFVTNNDLKTSGTASLTDLGTATITVAGNRL